MPKKQHAGDSLHLFLICGEPSQMIDALGVLLSQLYDFS